MIPGNVVFLLFVVIVFIGMSSACTVVNWRNMTMEERLYRADIVVYGKDIDHVQRNDSNVPNGAALDSNFVVMCVLKGDNQTINKSITIRQIEPRTTCSGTYKKVDINNRVIVGLKRTVDGNYEWDEVNVLQSAAFMATETTFEKVSKVCGLQNWAPSEGGQDCPYYPISLICSSYTDSSAVVSMQFFTVMIGLLLTFIATLERY